MEPRVDILVNRVASHLAHDGPILNAVRAATTSARSLGRAWLHETRTLSDLEAAVARIAARGTDCVLLAGGDGSYLAGTTALVRELGDSLPPVGFAPGGTVSTVARNWGLSGDRADYARDLVIDALAGRARVTPRPTLRVRDDRGGDHVGFIFGAGLVARFFDAYYEAPAQGSLAAAGLVARVFGGTFTRGALAERVLTPSPARLSVDGERQRPVAWSLIAASVLGDLGLHMRLLYRAGERHDAFHVVASALPPRRLSPQVVRVLRGQRLLGEGHVDRLSRELVVELGGSEEDAGATYVLDGDRIAARRVVVTAGPVLRYVSVNRGPRPRIGPSQT